MKGILKEKIVDAKIEFTLREVFDSTKKDFHDLIIGVIKKKRQIMAETVMMHALEIDIRQKTRRLKLGKCLMQWVI